MKGLFPECHPFGRQEWCIAYHFFFKKCLSLICLETNRRLYSDVQELLGLFFIRASLFQEATLGQLPYHFVEEMVIVINDLA